MQGGGMEIIMKHLEHGPVVFLAGEHYDIVWTTSVQGAAWVKSGGREYYDTVTGILRTEDTVHKVTVPKEVLDAEGGYTIFFRQVFEKTSYRPKSDEKAENRSFDFRPVRKNAEVNIYVIGDAHGFYKEAIAEGGYFGDKLDMLVLNGDIADNDIVAQLGGVLEIGFGVTHGNVPTVHVRGNHDVRGSAATLLHRFTGTDKGRFYFDFSAGDIYGIALDCGEDKLDSHIEYGGLNVFDVYRRKQTEFLDSIIGKGDYRKHRRVIVFCHIPLVTERNEPMADIYAEWVRRLNVIRPDVMICAHEHCTDFAAAGGNLFDRATLEFPVMTGSVLEAEWIDEVCCFRDIAGTAVSVGNERILMRVTDFEKKVREEYTI